MPTRVAVVLVLFLACPLACKSASTGPVGRPGGPASSSPARAATAPAPREWDAFVQCFYATEIYYNLYGGWGSPATEEQDKKVEAALGKALAELIYLVRDGQISPEEMALVRAEVKDIDRLGGRGYRNTRTPSGLEAHTDYFTPPAGTRAYVELEELSPLLEKAAARRMLSPCVARWLLPKVRGRADVLGDPESAKGVEFARDVENAIKFLRDGYPHLTTATAADLRQKALSLAARIEATAGCAVAK
jgi:hypothetical protein